MWNRVKAFTLMEFLVVVAIVAILVGMLLPALIRARIEAKINLVGKSSGIGKDVWRGREKLKAEKAGTDIYGWWEKEYKPIFDKCKNQKDAIRLILKKSMEDGIPIDDVDGNTESKFYPTSKAKFKSGAEIRTRLGGRIGIVISNQWDTKRRIFKYEVRFKNDAGYGNKDIEEVYEPELEGR